MSRTSSTIRRGGWRLSRCAAAILLAVPASAAFAATPGGQLARPYRASQMRPARVAQMPSAASDASVIYDGPSPAPQVYGHNGAESGNYMSGGNYSGPSGGMGCGDGCYGGSTGFGDAGWADGCGDGCDSYGTAGCYGDACNLCTSDCRPVFTVHFDWLYMQASGADVAHAQQQDGIGGAGTVPFGKIGSADTEYDSGMRFGFEVACGPCAGVVFSYTSFETAGVDLVEPPAIPGGSGAVGSLVHHPGASITASSGIVDATHQVDYEMGDLLYRGTLASSPRFSGNYLVGVQYGNLEQAFGQRGVFSGGQSGTIDTISTIDFDGGGLKAGVDGERRLSGGFSAYGRLTGAVMAGRFKSRYTMLNSTTDALLAEANWKDDRIVPQLEYELGFAWTSASDRCRFALGYMYSHWLNTVTVAEYIDAVQADNYVDVDDALSFDGLVTRAELRW